MNRDDIVPESFSPPLGEEGRKILSLEIFFNISLDFDFFNDGTASLDVIRLTAISGSSVFGVKDSVELDFASESLSVDSDCLAKSEDEVVRETK